MDSRGNQVIPRQIIPNWVNLYQNLGDIYNMCDKFSNPDFGISRASNCKVFDSNGILLEVEEVV